MCEPIFCTDRDCEHCHYSRRGAASGPPGLLCLYPRKQQQVQPWDVCDDFRRKDAVLPNSELDDLVKQHAARGLARCEAKLDALTELVEAMAGVMVGDTYTTPHKHLARILARRWGQCSVCLGACLVPLNGANRQPCTACNGTGKAQGGSDG